MAIFLFLIAVVGWAYLYSRLRNAEDRLTKAQQERERDSETIAQLTRRVFALEKVRSVEPGTTKPEVSPVPVRPIVRPVERPEPHVVVETARAVPPPPESPIAEPVLAQPEPFRESIHSEPSWTKQIRASMGGQEWEAVVGGNWLNKLGVLVLVIGIALLLGYEFTHVGPAGRVAIGMGVGLTMLVSGVFVERKRGYEIFARGLIGGGWAALYFTTYAMHAIAAAKVIDNPYLATGLLLVVACGMILHSLRYKSQTVSGLAYFIAFATLELSESTPFSVLALLPLAASLLFLAHRFQWHRMAVFGLFATYAVVASRPDVGAPLASTQALFAAYWILFEIFDLLRLRRSTATWSIESFILPGNGSGFLALSIVKWQRMAPEHLWAFSAAGAALYLASALLRVTLRPSVSWGEDSTTADRIAGGSYEGPTTISAGLAAAAIMLRAKGEWINVSLLIEGELLFLAGWRWGQGYLRRLATIIFAGSVVKTALLDPTEGASVAFAGHMWRNWSPIALLSSAIFYVNRALVAKGLLYSTGAAGLIATVLGFETPREYLCVAWLAFTAVLFETGFRLREAEFRFQSYIVGAIGTGTGLVLNSLGFLGGRPDSPLALLPLAICSALHYAATLRINLSNDDRLLDAEKKISWITAASCTGFLFVIAWKLVPLAYIGAAWLILGAILFELGLRGLPKHFRWLSYFVSAAGACGVFWSHVMNAQIGSRGAEPISLAIAAVVCCTMSARVFRSMADRIDDWEREWTRDIYAGLGVLFAMALAWVELIPPVVSLVWTVCALAVFEIGARYASGRFRLLVHCIMTAVWVRLLSFDLAGFGDAIQISYRTYTILPIIVAHYYIGWRSRKASVEEWEQAIFRVYLTAPAVLFLMLARFELGATAGVVAWALFGLVAFAIGRLRKIVDLRWQSYGIALLSFSFSAWILAENRASAVTASFVIASLYVAQLLAPRSAAEAAERYARGLFSLLATLLLAILLYSKVSGGTLTIVWAAEALALLGAGFPLRDRVQRLSGLTLFMICVLKLFLYDLRELETISRILSFIVLGLILVGVSWMYTRFRDRIQRYL